MVNWSSGLVAVALIHAAVAVPKTYPLIAWSSFNSQFSSAESSSAQVEALFDRLIFHNNVCNFDAVILVNQPGLHVSDLRALSSSSGLSKMLNAAPSSLQLPYVELQVDKSHPRVVNDISHRCGSRPLNSISEAKGLHKEDITGNKFVVNVHVPPLQEASGSRKEQMVASEHQLSEELESLVSAFPNHLVVYSDWHPSAQGRIVNLSSRQDPSSNSTLPAGGILKRYQLLSPGLILSLFLTFFVLLPIAMMGISALASIQSPLRLDGKVLADYKQKKNQ